ncbi:MAG UNVERIFIED_CONTAM: outer membrane protein assembly factor BamE [Rickettsiaceae bacterium]|jgi:outer membrane protein assembly factor BamE (lipoprotein component of BamABCDE complex)
MNKILLLTLVFILSGCQSVNRRGIYLEDEKIKQIEGGQISREQLVYTIGQPTLKPDYSPDTWYYVSRTLANKSWSKPSLYRQRVVKITFKNDIVENVEVIDTKKHPNVTIADDFTVSKGTEENPVQTFVKNFGRFNKTNRNKRR